MILFFNPTGWTNFAQFYKRDKYRWEDETRLSLNLSYLSLLGNGLEYKTDGNGNQDKGIICIKNNKNPFINWGIKSITFGAKCSQKDKEEIKSILESNYANTRIIERT